MSLPKNSLHPCKGCEFAVSLQGYFNECKNTKQLEKLRRVYSVPPYPETCGAPFTSFHKGEPPCETN